MIISPPAGHAARAPGRPLLWMRFPGERFAITSRGGDIQPDLLFLRVCFFNVVCVPDALLLLRCLTRPSLHTKYYRRVCGC